jgi:hypothetical protein
MGNLLQDGRFPNRIPLQDGGFTIIAVLALPLGAVSTALFWGLTRIAELLYGVSPTDPLVFGAVLLLSGIVAFAANYIPRLRATQVD